MTHMRAIPKPAYARMQRAKKRLKAAQLAANAVRVRERDGDRCRAYGTTGWLEVHHIKPRSRGGTHDTSNLVLLSKRAHDEVHAGLLKIEGNADEMLTFTHMFSRTRRVA